ncbi:MAG: ClbS/DfsB family four-helix bundle protein [Cardiobacteriaceae bacterium]|nr:ClbS/DfsB family four-helix bundle protein [Cardiobacteriaceae bacterium]
MTTYPDAQTLITAIQTALDQYLAEFADIPDTLKSHRAINGERTPSEHLSYQLGWTNALLQWERDEQHGKTPHLPAKGHRWNNLTALNQHFHTLYGTYTLAEQQQLLRENVAAICAWLTTLSDTELFQPGQRQWTTTPAQWPLWKWTHINTVAPFTNFRSKIRKWKKAALTETPSSNKPSNALDN